MTELERVIEFAKSKSVLFDSIYYECEWNEYRVYSRSFEVSGDFYIGLPVYILLAVSSFIYLYLAHDFLGIIEAVISMILFIWCIIDHQNVLCNKVFVWLGTISYPVYLIHQNIGYIIENALLSFGSFNFFLVGILAIVLVIMLGAALFYIIERNSKAWVSVITTTH